MSSNVRGPTTHHVPTDCEPPKSARSTTQYVAERADFVGPEGRWAQVRKGLARSAVQLVHGLAGVVARTGKRGRLHVWDSL